MGFLSSQKATEIPFKDFAPDLPPQTPGILLDTDGVVPTMKGYAAREAPVDVSSVPLPGFNPPAVTPNGGFIAYYSDGSHEIFAATQTNIYRLDGTTWTDVGGPYTVTTRWQFAQFLDEVIAVADGVVPQAYAGPGGSFTPLGGSPPSNATHVVAVAGTVFMTQGANWRNSAFGVSNNWTPNIQTQSGAGALTDFPGDVTALAALYRSVYAFKNNSILLGSFVGGQSTWSFQILSNKTGVLSQGAVVLLPDAIAFAGTDDFYLSSGYAPQRIPNNLKEWFFARVDPQYLDRIEAWYDPHEAIIYWHAVSFNAPLPGVPDFFVSYNVRAQRWATGKLVTYGLIPNTITGVANGLFFNTLGKLRSWAGDPSPGLLVTGFMGDPGLMTQSSAVRAQYNVVPSGQVIIPRSVYVLGDIPSVSAPAVLAADGWHYFRQTNRYHQVQIGTQGAMEITGLAFRARTAGIR